MDRATVDALLEGLTRTGDELPFNRHMGVTVRALQPGRAETVLAASDDLANHVGGVHAVAELAPAELCGALAVSSRLTVLLERGFVPVVAGMRVRYRAPARGELTATCEVGEDVVGPALAAAEAGERPRVEATIEVRDGDGTVVAEVTPEFVYLDLASVPS